MTANAIDGIEKAAKNACEEFCRQPFYERIRVANAIDLTANWEAIKISWNGYAKCIDEFAASVGPGEYYVYVWKHFWTSKIFYVGSGKGDRWIENSGRPDEFYREIDNGDAVVYKVIDGLDMRAARFVERYISFSLGLGGMPLVNRDNSINRTRLDVVQTFLAQAKTGLNKDVIEVAEKVVENYILFDPRYIGKEEVVGMVRFKQRYGDAFFRKKQGLYFNSLGMVGNKS